MDTVIEGGEAVRGSMVGRSFQPFNTKGFVCIYVRVYNEPMCWVG